jgi:hypothetical protein
MLFAGRVAGGEGDVDTGGGGRVVGGEGDVDTGGGGNGSVVASPLLVLADAGIVFASVFMVFPL